MIVWSSGSLHWDFALRTPFSLRTYDSNKDVSLRTAAVCQLSTHPLCENSSSLLGECTESVNAFEILISPIIWHPHSRDKHTAAHQSNAYKTLQNLPPTVLRSTTYSKSARLPYCCTSSQTRTGVSVFISRILLLLFWDYSVLFL